jgi:signal transduction histidine kinase
LDNKLEGYLKVTRDYTLQQRVREESQRALDKERELNEMKSNFVSMASHEFRSPLTTIRSSVSLIEKYVEINDAQKAQKHIQRVKSSVTELLEILEDFLSLEKIEQGKVEIQKEMVNVKEIVGEHCDKLESLLKTGQKIEYNHNGDTDSNTDTRALWHILTNLVSNASKYSPANSSISVSTNLYGPVLTLSVKDSGIGMSSDDQKHLFNRFFRASNAESIKGTGLGLHIVKRYVDLQGGQITVDSELNSGSMFTVTLNSA